MIIVEGPDGTGKSRLVKDLSEDLGLTVGSRGDGVNRENLHESDVKGDVYRALANEVASEFPPVIWDRLFFSELVYAKIINNRDAVFNDADQWYIRKLMSVIDCKIILCYPPRITAEKNIAESTHLTGVQENMKKLYDAYSKVFRFKTCHILYPLKIIRYDYTSTMSDGHKPPVLTDYETIRKQIALHIKRREERCKW